MPLTLDLFSLMLTPCAYLPLPLRHAAIDIDVAAFRLPLRAYLLRDAASFAVNYG